MVKDWKGEENPWRGAALTKRAVVAGKGDQIRKEERRDKRKKEETPLTLVYKEGKATAAELCSGC